MSQHHTRVGHTSIAAKARPRIAASLPAPCIRCGRPVTKQMQWHVGHRTDIALGGDPKDVGPEHASCNLRAGGKAGAAKTNAGKRTQTIEDKRLLPWLNQ